jgi:hypothetical protein
MSVVSKTPTYRSGGIHMAKTGNKDKSQAGAPKSGKEKQRRALLKKLGRFAAVSAPAVTLLLAAETKAGAVPITSCAAALTPPATFPMA